MATGDVDNDITMSEEEIGSVLDGREEHSDESVRVRSATPPQAPKKPAEAPSPRLPARRAPVPTLALAPAHPPHRVHSPPAPLPPPPGKKFHGGGAGGGTAAGGDDGRWPGCGRG